MSIFTKPSAVSGGTTYFKPKEHDGHVALLIEPKRIDKNVPNTYNGITKDRDEVTATITVFDTALSLETGVPARVIEDCKIVHGMLTRAAERVLGGAMVARVEMIPTKAGNGWAFQDVSDDIEGKVGTYFTEREQKLAAAVAAAPDDF